MSKKEALQILMLSPFFFRLSITERKELIKEFIERAVKTECLSTNGFVLGYD